MSSLVSPFRPSERMLRQFGWIWLVFFSAAASWQWLHYQRGWLAKVLLTIAVTIGPVGIAWPGAIKPVFVVWMAVVYPVGWIVSHVLLASVFYGLFSPIG